MANVIRNSDEAARYGNLARVAADFYISTGNPAEQDAAYVYARLAAFFAGKATIENEPTAMGRAIRAAYPEVYFVPGIGYCGPQWHLAEIMRRRLSTEMEIR